MRPLLSWVMAGQYYTIYHPGVHPPSQAHTFRYATHPFLFENKLISVTNADECLHCPTSHITRGGALNTRLMGCADKKRKYVFQFFLAVLLHGGFSLCQCRYLLMHAITFWVLLVLIAFLILSGTA